MRFFTHALQSSTGNSLIARICFVKLAIITLAVHINSGQTSISWNIFRGNTTIQ